jgi:glycosyltransferase involved in cell wall biosynthesis
MKVSYIIPVYNGSASITKCVEHILYQRGNFDKEIIIVDDGSVDNTVDAVIDNIEPLFKTDNKLLGTIKIHSQIHSGASCARNNGLLLASGDYIAFVDADTFLDIPWTEQCLKEDPSTYDILLTNDLKYHEEDPNCRAIYEKIEKNPYISHDNLIGFIGNGTFLPAKNRYMIKYDEMYIVGGEDIDILLRLIDAGAKLKMSNKPSFLHRHMHRSTSIKYLSFIKKKVLFGYGNWRTFFKHLNSVYARRDAVNNWWCLPLYPFLWIYKKLHLK